MDIIGRLVFLFGPLANQFARMVMCEYRCAMGMRPLQSALMEVMIGMLAQLRHVHRSLYSHVRKIHDKPTILEILTPIILDLVAHEKRSLETFVIQIDALVFGSYSRVIWRGTGSA